MLWFHIKNWVAQFLTRKNDRRRNEQKSWELTVCNIFCRNLSKVHIFWEGHKLTVKSKVEISQNVFALSEYTNFTPNMMTDFCQIYTNCLKIQNGSPIMNNLCESSKKWRKSIIIFWVNWWQNMLIWQRTSCGSYCQNVFI